VFFDYFAENFPSSTMNLFFINRCKTPRILKIKVFDFSEIENCSKRQFKLVTGITAVENFPKKSHLMFSRFSLNWLVLTLQTKKISNSA
jgi:hypothetical protein